MRGRRLLGIIAVATAVSTHATNSLAQHADGAALVRLLGARAQDAFAPRGAPAMGAIVRLPAGVSVADLGLREIAPGFARLWGPPSSIVSFAAAHPDLPIEVSPPLHLLLDTAAGSVHATAANASGYDGKGVLVGIADTGIDLTHPNFQDAGGTRVQWLLDLSSKPIGKYPDLEQQYGSKDMNGNLVLGAVWAKTDIDAALAAGPASGVPQDEIGHGTLVASCAAGQDPRYRGVAPQAGLVIARVADSSGGIGNDEMMRGVAFLFDRADALGQPVVVNLSLGSDFGPHDGTAAWEQVLASYVDSSHPGHALVVAAGNSGSIAETPVHQNVYVSRRATTRVPISTDGADMGGAQVWVTMHAGAHVSVGLDAPDGTWISPVGVNASAGKNTDAYNAAIYNGSEPNGSPVPSGSHGAVVVWQGKWPSGTYYVTLSGVGTVDLYVEGTGDASMPPQRNVAFVDGVRESTISLPATHPAIIGVGCTINKRSWRSVAGEGIGFGVPVLDAVGGRALPDAMRDPIAGEPCWFSSAGPTLTGVPKPEIMAPGAAIVGAMSQQAVPPGSFSIFTPGCPTTSSAGGSKCNEIDQTHGVSQGTSFSAPLVAGAVALLFQHDPTLTQGDVVGALQAGAHPLRAAGPFDDQAGAGELDVAGALAAADRLRDPQFALPSRSESWMTLGADVYLADGSTPLEAILELRSARSGVGAPQPADGFDGGRLAAYAVVERTRTPVPVRRVAPGVWVVTVNLSAGLGGSSLTIGATFDGADIVGPKSLPIATDMWTADYAPRAMGGCAVPEVHGRGPAGAGGAAAVLLLAVLKRRRAAARIR